MCGRVDEWKSGRLEEWKSGIVEEWRWQAGLWALRRVLEAAGAARVAYESLRRHVRYFSILVLEWRSGRVEEWKSGRVAGAARVACVL